MCERVVCSTMRWFLSLAAALCCLGTFAHTQRPPDSKDRRTSPQVPLLAELLAPLDAAKLSRGAAVLAKARFDWNDPTCRLRAGSVVSGHIIDIEQRSKQNKGSSLTLSLIHI